MRLVSLFRFQNRRMKWRNTKERELLTSNSSNANINQLGETTDSISGTKHSVNHEKSNGSHLSNDCYDCQQEKTETNGLRSDFILDHDDESSDSDIDINDDTEK